MKIVYQNNCFQKIMYWVNKASDEVGGFCLVKYDPASKTFTAVDAFLLEQDVGAAHTDIDAKSLGKLLYAVREKRTEGLELKLWWHSHVKMNVFWSGQDRSTIEDLGKNGYIVATVFNQKNEMKSAVCVKTSSDLGDSVTFYDDIKTEVESIQHPDVVLWDKEYTDNVKKKVYSPPLHNYDDYYSRFGGNQAWRNESFLDKPLGKPTKEEKKKEKKELKKYNTEYNYYMKKGLIGYGAEIESKALKLGVEEYIMLLIDGTAAELDALEVRLWTLETSDGGFYGRP